MNNVLVKVEHLSRYYGPNIAVNTIGFEVRRGEVLGFLGPNGAGKTSTMQMITGNLAPSAGRIEIGGVDLLDNPKQAKTQIGYLPELPPLYRELSVDEYLQFCARIHRVPKTSIHKSVAYAKERCGLNDVGPRLIGNLSKGYQQRVGIAQAIVHLPAVIVLDEPTVGLDPIQIREIRSLIRELGKDHAVILSTHILPEVQMTCDHVQIISKGNLVYRDTISNLNQQARLGALTLGLNHPPELSALQSLPQVQSVEPLGNQRWKLLHAHNANPAQEIATIAVNQQWGLCELTPEYKSLEQFFVDITMIEPKPEANPA
ncbi:MAG: ATP-binding cassette domain-containing protein [Gammaproteobacteria bacterium]|nr:ATP-binding cassette domain-containing protein [Gammaproteobacteria bacterium]